MTPPTESISAGSGPAAAQTGGFYGTEKSGHYAKYEAVPISSPSELESRSPQVLSELEANAPSELSAIPPAEPATRDQEPSTETARNT